MKSKKKSIKDVAVLAGVSPTTVSRVLNKSDYPVSRKTKAAVEAAIKELDFKPNRMARGLIKNKSQIIGVIVHDISDDYFAEMVKGIEKIMFKYDYIVNIYNTYRNINKELKAVNMLQANRADAVVLAAGHLVDNSYEERMQKYISNLINTGTVVVGVTTHPFDIKNIEIGNTLAVRTITDYLLNKGHRQIAYVNGPEILGTTWERIKGFKAALKSRGVLLDKKYIIEGDFSFEGGRLAAKKSIKLVRDLTAVVCSNDETALGFMWELKNQGISVPEDVSVVGVGNIPSARYSYPPLTTIALPIYNLGFYIGSYLLNNLDEKEVNNDEFEVQISLVERNSVREIRDFMIE